MRDHKIAAALLVLVLATGAATWAQAQTATNFSLAGDWSDTSNPNGPWSYNQGSTPLPPVPVWTAADSTLVGCSQPAWAPSNFSGNFLPGMMKANACSANIFGTDPNSGLGNVLPGDIVTHTVDPFNGNPSLGVANFLFTLPAGDDGKYEIKGSAWDAGLFFGTTRPQDWALLINGVAVASGFLSGTVSRSQAQTFDLFADLAAGQTVELELFEDPSAAAGFFVGTTLTIIRVSAAAVPFAAFAAKVEVERESLSLNTGVEGRFTLGSASNGIAPLTEAVSFQIGNFSGTIPAGSFHYDAVENKFEFEGLLNGTSVEASIKPTLTPNTFRFEIEVKGTDLTGGASTVGVQLTIGNDAGTTTAPVETD